MTYPCCCSTHSPCTQGCRAQWSAPDRHSGPWVLGGHKHWNPLILSLQVPPLKHGFERHSSISTSHLTPIGESGSEWVWWIKSTHLIYVFNSFVSPFKAMLQTISGSSYLTPFLKCIEQKLDCTCVSWGTHTLVLVDAILALSIFTGVACTVVFIDLAVYSWKEWGTT